MSFSPFESHHREALPDEVRALFGRIPYAERKRVLTDRLTELDITYAPEQPIPVSFLPRILPREYFRTVEACSRALTELQFAALWDDGFRNGPLRQPGVNAALEACGAFDLLPTRIVGGARYDFAVEGPLVPDNPPRILELNNIDYAGGGWIPNSHRALWQAVPELAEHAEDLEQVHAVGRNLLRIGKRFLQVTGDAPDSATDYTLFRQDLRDMAGIEVVGVEDTVFADEAREGRVHFTPQGVVRNGERFDAIYFRTMGTRREVDDFGDVIKRIVSSRVPTYDSFAQLLLENKGLWRHLVEWSDRLVDAPKAALLRRMMLPTEYLTKPLMEAIRRDPRERVLKKADGHLGKTVYVGEELLPILDTIEDPREWCVQSRVRLNTLATDPSTAGPMTSIVDLGVYVTFEWDPSRKGADRLVHFEVAGLLTRSSPDNPKVNVALGGCVVPVFVAKA